MTGPRQATVLHRLRSTALGAGRRRPAARTISQARALLVLLLLLAAGAQPAHALERDRAGDLIGETRSYRAAPKDTLVAVARRFDLGYVELIAANPGVDPWLIEAGRQILLPGAHLLPAASRQGIVINLAEPRLYFFDAADGAVRSFPVGSGRAGHETPTGLTRVVSKRYKPTWVPPASLRAERPDLPAAVPPGPDNPLGDYALDLAWGAYVIHGTNRPGGIGRRVSHGCVRLYPDDIAWLFGEVPLGTPVRIVDQPVKLGWVDGELYLEVHPTQRQADELERAGRFTPAPIPELEWRVAAAAGGALGRLDWAAVHRAASERRGTPVRITR